ncbi:hypothetical protein ACOMHN_006014 [Nucella lapillus]
MELQTNDQRAVRAQRERSSRGNLNGLFDRLRAALGGGNLSKKDVLEETIARINLLEGLNAAQRGNPLQVTPTVEGKQRMAEGEMEEEGEGERGEESEVLEKMAEGEMEEEGEGERGEESEVLEKMAEGEVVDDKDEVERTEEEDDDEVERTEEEDKDEGERTEEEDEEQEDDEDDLVVFMDLGL